MAFQSIPQSTFASGFGGGVGQGLAEQLPKEVERGRMAHGLKNLGEDFHNLSPVEQISRLVSIPGINAQTAMQFIPYIRESQARKALLERGGQGEGIQKGQKSGSFLEREKQHGFKIAPSPESIDAEAANLIKSGAYVNADEARNAAKERQQSQYAQDVSIDQRRQEGYQFIDKGIQSKGIRLSGELRDKFANDYVADVLDNNMSNAQAEAATNKKLLDFSKTQTAFKNLFSKNMFAKERPAVQKGINQSRKDYKDLGALEQFSDDLQSYGGYSPELAGQFAYPIEKTSPGINKILSEVKPNISPGIKIGPFPIISSLKPIPASLVKKIANPDILNPNVSMKGLAREFELKGYDPQSFLDQIKEHQELLTPRQQRELVDPASRQRYLGDLWFNYVEARKRI